MPSVSPTVKKAYDAWLRRSHSRIPLDSDPFCESYRSAAAASHDIGPNAAARIAPSADRAILRQYSQHLAFAHPCLFFAGTAGKFEAPSAALLRGFGVAYSLFRYPNAPHARP